MKAVIIMVAIVAIIGALNGYTGYFIDNSADELLSGINEAKQAVQAGDQAAASDRVKKLRDGWESVESRWEVLEDHREIDRIDTLMTHLEAMADTGVLDTMMPELDELAFFLTHIDDKHKIKMENIF